MLQRRVVDIVFALAAAYGISITSVTRGIYSCKQLSGDYFIHLPNLPSAPPSSILPSGVLTALNLSGGGGTILSRAEPSLYFLLALEKKATICLCISDKHFIFSPPHIHLSIHSFIVWCPCVCQSFALWAPLHTCDILPVQFDRVTVLSHVHVATCVLRHTHVRH